MRPQNMRQKSETMTRENYDMNRECGMLLPVSSLPSRYGIGTFSKEAYEFVDQLKEGGQKNWQILPLGPTGFGDSPYQTYSAFAGSPYYIDLDGLVEDGLLTTQECEEVDFGNDPVTVDYDKLAAGRIPLLRKAYDRWKQQMQEANLGTIGERIEAELGEDTREYCLYMAIKDSQGGTCWAEWDEPLKLRKKAALDQFQKEHEDEIHFYAFMQLKFQGQWAKLKLYAKEKGIKIVGDIPIYVAFDSADAWSHPELFQFDKDGKPQAVAGCPPDAFAATGQLWGNPLYQWDYHKKTGYGWWMKRMAYSFRMFDVVRVDHFRGFDEYYAIPAGDPTAEFGKWEKGPGLELFTKMKKEFPDLDIIAEDLGFLTPSVLELVKNTGFPGMKILEFAFDSGSGNAYLTHHYTENCIVYTGTHDNDTLRGWLQTMPDYARDFAIRYMNSAKTDWNDLHWDFIRLAMASVAKTAIIPVQDYLGLGSEARINEPGTVGKNWKWRMRKGALTGDILWRCKDMACLYGRAEWN